MYSDADEAFTVRGEHVYTTSGEFEVTVIVRDDGGAEGRRHRR